jgi:hypothetical protein
MGFTALTLLRRNIEALLEGRKESQTTLAFALSHDKSWLNKFLRGSREIQFSDLDKIAQFIGVATYQLFQPGISALTERRSQLARRSGRDRRVGHSVRAVLETREEVERGHGHGAVSRSVAEIETTVRHVKQVLRDAQTIIDSVDPQSAGSALMLRKPRVARAVKVAVALALLSDAA